MNCFSKRVCTLGLAAAAALAVLVQPTAARAEALVTQGSSELGVGGNLDFTSSVGTDIGIDVRYAYFFWDRISIGGVAGFGDNDDATSFKLGMVGEYNFKIPDNYRPVIGTDFVPFVGLGLAYHYADINHDHENALVFTGEGGVKFFLTDSAAITLSGVVDLATEEIYPDDDDANRWNFAFLLGMRFYF